jgi:uncharacterized protein
LNGTDRDYTDIVQSLLAIWLPSFSVPASEHLSSFVNIQNSSGNTALHWAALNGHLDVVKLLVDVGGADPSVTNAAGHDAVFEAERNDRGPVVEWFLKEVPGLERAVGGGEGGEVDGEVDGGAEEEKQEEQRGGRSDGRNGDVEMNRVS